MTRALVYALCCVVTSCAAHGTPATPAAKSWLFIRDTLPGDVQLCVLRNPFLATGLACIPVGELRLYIRARLEARLTP